MTDIPYALQAWVELAQAYGWTYSDTADGKLKLTPPEGLMDPVRQRPAYPIIIGKSPQDEIGYPNLAMLLRRLGVPIPTKRVMH